MARRCINVGLSVVAAMLACCAVLSGEAPLQIKTKNVYVLPMPNQLDRYVASRLTRSGVLRVVLDPERADSVITDRLDDGFRNWSRSHYATGTPPQKNVFPPYDPRRGDNPGTMFLVDPKTGLVLWSIYEPVDDTSSYALDQVAEQVAKRLKASLKRK